MNKIKIHIRDYTEVPEGYSTMYPPTKEEILDKIIQTIPSDQRYIEHFIHTKWTKDDTLPIYKPNNTSLERSQGTLTYSVNVITEDR